MATSILFLCKGLTFQRPSSNAFTRPRPRPAAPQADPPADEKVHSGISHGPSWNHLRKSIHTRAVTFTEPFWPGQNSGPEIACDFAAEGVQKKCELWPVTGPGRLGASCQLAKGAWRLSPILLDAKK